MQLQKFCCHEKEFSLPAYKQPMRDGRHVFASNLRIAIRAEISPECESSSGPVLPTIQKLFERVEERRYLVTDWHAMPLMDRHRFGVCGFCDGHGHLIDCDHCYGEGAVIRKNQSLNCRSCQGKGARGASQGSRCFHCHGFNVASDATLQIGPSTFAVRDLLLLNEQIPFVQIGIDKNRPDSSAILVAGSVLGALMPTRQRAVARHESAASAR